MRELNERERAVLACIRKKIHETGYAPSVRELGESLGLRSTSTVQMYLDRLEEMGYLRRTGGKSRSLPLPEVESHPIRVFAGEMPHADVDEVELGEALPFCYTGELPPGAHPVAFRFDGEYWIVACGETPDAEATVVSLADGVPSLALQKEACGSVLGRLLGRIRI